MKVVNCGFLVKQIFGVYKGKERFFGRFFRNTGKSLPVFNDVTR